MTVVRVSLTAVSMGTECIIVQEGQIPCYVVRRLPGSTLGVERTHQGLNPKHLEWFRVQWDQRKPEEERQRGFICRTGIKNAGDRGRDLQPTKVLDGTWQARLERVRDIPHYPVFSASASLFPSPPSIHF